MELVRVTAPLAARHHVAAMTHEHAVLFECRDAHTVLAAASIKAETTAPFGVWLVVGPAYPAQLAARDVATLSRIVDVRDVVIEAATTPAQHVAVVAALLRDGEVNFANDVAVLRGAFNRPVPPTPPRLWAYEGERLVGQTDTLDLGRRESLDGVELTFFGAP